MIFKKENKFYIQDKASKFGTLLYLNTPFCMLNNSKDIMLSSGKAFLNFSVYKNTSFFSNIFSAGWCCSCKIKEDEITLNFNNDKCEDEFHRSNDSYDDNILVLDTIIKINENI